ncbi:hypothetical protein NP493_31g06014 [Ridgeia piscesae]|uniref:Protein kinase domain-containing protein n=1 Tax=Ridgeia piscesae TaxID=27915 RepID=A0AAD9PD41_RIDPI|nr:hypothetical protein NP493_31g06014 [Ridgeia piscesae]
MDASALLRQDLKVPDACCRKLSESRFVCLVHGRWLKQLQRHHVVENVTAEKYFTSDECQLHLAASYKNVPAPWTRVCVKVIQKSNSYIHSTPNSCVCLDDEEPAFSEVLITASQHAWQLTNDTAHRRYHSAVTCGSTHKVAPPYKDLIPCTRTALKRVFNCDIIPLVSKQNELSANRNVPETPICRQSYMNLTGAYAVIESEQAFHVIQPYVQYSLYDTVTFSPTQLQHHRVTSLFILYQILRAIQQCHDLGVSVGDLRLSDILIDSKLWVQVAPVHLGHSWDRVQGRSAALNRWACSLFRYASCGNAEPN